MPTWTPLTDHKPDDDAQVDLRAAHSNGGASSFEYTGTYAKRPIDIPWKFWRPAQMPFGE